MHKGLPCLRANENIFQQWLKALLGKILHKSPHTHNRNYEAVNHQIELLSQRCGDQMNRTEIHCSLDHSLPQSPYAMFPFQRVVNFQCFVVVWPSFLLCRADWVFVTHSDLDCRHAQPKYCQYINQKHSYHGGACDMPIDNGVAFSHKLASIIAVEWERRSIYASTQARPHIHCVIRASEQTVWGKGASHKFGPNLIPAIHLGGYYFAFFSHRLFAASFPAGGRELLKGVEKQIWLGERKGTIVGREISRSLFHTLPQVALFNFSHGG